MVAVVKRSLNLLDGILCLVDRWNFAAAAPLLRLQIDSLLKLVYLARLKDPNDVLKAILKGKPFQKLKDSDGKCLTDARLRDYARPLYPWYEGQTIDEIFERAKKQWLTKEA